MDEQEDDERSMMELNTFMSSIKQPLQYEPETALQYFYNAKNKNHNSTCKFCQEKHNNQIEFVYLMLLMDLKADKEEKKCSFLLNEML